MYISRDCKERESMMKYNVFEGKGGIKMYLNKRE